MNTLSVSALNEYVRRTLASDPMLHSIRLEGEVSNFKQHSSGHWYFSLKDEKSRIACVMFRQFNMLAKTVPMDGMRVILTGSVGLYTAAGSYQFYAEGIEKSGTGALYEQFLKLKEKLEKEGLFDPARKKTLPMLPKAVGIITSETGAVLHDIYNVVNKRFPGMTLLLRPSSVQGDTAAAELKSAIEDFEKSGLVDVIIIGRGGGSMEDLWPFNDEALVRAIADCSVPVISAVGHDTDFTLCDFVADVRAATPSQAAEFAVPDKLSLKSGIMEQQRRLFNAAQYLIQRKDSNVQQLKARLIRQSPEHKLTNLKNVINADLLRLNMSVQKHMLECKAQLDSASKHLNAVSPMETLKRGYTIVRKGDKLVRSYKDAQGEMSITFYDGIVKVKEDKSV
ncbi:MAG: exodeoxyribonuclease VII large subunit [Christensenellaceae bacterium]|nr:exodeoxyribonuclease VII large subunit [Christensenellaceae bacterium]